MVHSVRWSALIAVVSSALLRSSALSAQLPPALERPPSVTIGAFETPDEEVFGTIRSLAVDALGNIIVLDAQAKVLRAFDRSGRYIATAGREGRGPQEFFVPVEVRLDAHGTIHVLDPANQRITRLQIDDASFVPLTDIRFPRAASSFCFLNEQLFVAHPTYEGVLHQVDSSGAVVATFGVPEPLAEEHRELQGNAPNLARLMNRGRVACDSVSGTVIFVHRELPLVRAFSPHGIERWRTVLPDYANWRRIPSRGEGGSRGVRMATDPDARMAHDAAAVTTMGELVFVTLKRTANAGQTINYELRILRSADGTQILEGEISGVLFATRGDRYYVVRSEPFPQVAIF